jgi:uncharacterized protein YuzE
MAKKLKIWYDKEGDYLELLFSDAAGYMRETNNDFIMERVDEAGNVIGYSIIGISKMKKDNPIYTELEFV